MVPPALRDCKKKGRGVAELALVLAHRALRIDSFRA